MTMIPYLLVLSIGVIIGYYAGNEPFRTLVNTKLKKALQGKPKKSVKSKTK